MNNYLIWMHNFIALNSWKGILLYDRHIWFKNYHTIVNPGYYLRGSYKGGDQL